MAQCAPVILWLLATHSWKELSSKPSVFCSCWPVTLGRNRPRSLQYSMATGRSLLEGVVLEAFPQKYIYSFRTNQSSWIMEYKVSARIIKTHLYQIRYTAGKPESSFWYFFHFGSFFGMNKTKIRYSVLFLRDIKFTCIYNSLSSVMSISPSVLFIMVWKKCGITKFLKQIIKRRKLIKWRVV